MELVAALSAEPSQVAVARQLLRGYLDERRLPSDADDLDVPVLLVSELVTNAIRHAQPPLQLWAESVGPGVRVEVHDGAVQPPVLCSGLPDEDRECGRGLHLVASLADRWGWVGNGTGKSVWFELDAV